MVREISVLMIRNEPVMVLSERTPNFIAYIYIGVDIGPIFHAEPFPSVRLPTQVNQVRQSYIRFYILLSSFSLTNPEYNPIQILDAIAARLIPSNNTNSVSSGNASPPANVLSTVSHDHPYDLSLPRFNDAMTVSPNAATDAVPVPVNQNALLSDIEFQETLDSLLAELGQHPL